MKLLLYNCLDLLTDQWSPLVQMDDVSAFVAITWDDVLRILHTVDIDIAMIRVDENAPAGSLSAFPKTRFYLLDDRGACRACGQNMLVMRDPAALRTVAADLVNDASVRAAQ